LANQNKEYVLIWSHCKICFFIFIGIDLDWRIYAYCGWYVRLVRFIRRCIPFFSYFSQLVSFNLSLVLIAVVSLEIIFIDRVRLITMRLHSNDDVRFDQSRANLLQTNRFLYYHSSWQQCSWICFENSLPVIHQLLIFYHFLRLMEFDQEYIFAKEHDFHM